MAQTFVDRYSQILRVLIEETVEEEKEFLVANFHTESAPVNHRIGMIAGLRKALSLMDEAESVLLGRERSQ
jgi:hypothetical protein